MTALIVGCRFEKLRPMPSNWAAKRHERPLKQHGLSARTPCGESQAWKSSSRCEDYVLALARSSVAQGLDSAPGLAVKSVLLLQQPLASECLLARLVIPLR